MAENEVLTYRAALALAPAEALLLGVNDPANSDERLRVAQRIAAERAEIEDAAYAKAHFMREPNVPTPFGLHLLIDAGGDLEKATSSPYFLTDIKEHLGLSSYDHFVRDEDGERWEHVPQAENADELAQAEVAAIRADLGLQPAGTHPARGQAGPGPREVGRSELQRRVAELRSHPAPSTPKSPHLPPPAPQRSPGR